MGQATTNVVTAVAGLTFPLYAPDPADLTALNHAVCESWTALKAVTDPGFSAQYIIFKFQHQRICGKSIRLVNSP